MQDLFGSVRKSLVEEGGPIRWRKGELIGCGAFARVYMGINLDSGELLAVKQVLIGANSASKEKAQAHIRELEEEVNLLKNLSHPYIVRYLGISREEDTLNFLLEFVPGGSISSLLGRLGSLPEAVIKKFTRQLLQGLEYLHHNKIIHRDIKGANILVDNKGHIKLVDFGASKKVPKLATMQAAKSMKGTPYWMAPEVIVQSGHSFSADIWSVGCTVIEMATGKPPWSQQYREVEALFHVGTTKSHPPIPEHLSSEAKDFLLKCLQQEPNLRPTASDLLKHPFIAEEYQDLHPLRRSSAAESSSSMYQTSKSNMKSNFSPIGRPSTSSGDSRSVDCGGGGSSAFSNEKLLGARPMWENNTSGDMCRFDDGDDFLVVGSSFNPMSEPFDEWSCMFDMSPVQRMDLDDSSEPIQSTSDRDGRGENDFSFHCDVVCEDDDEVTETKIKAFLEEKFNQSGSRGLELYPHNKHEEKNNGQSHQTTSESEQAECIDGSQFANFRDEWSSLEVLYSDIKDATKDFDESSKIGKGGYGSVYKGKLGEVMVAIKVLDSTSKQGQREFFQELEVLYQMWHPNLVKLVGACFEVRALVYEYLPHGSLEDCLKENPTLLTWQMRTRIMYEICLALIYLHSKSVVHGDLKPANILLDANFKSKLSDFGLCRFLPKDKISAVFLETVPKGTSGYIDPWFLETCILRPGSDLYSFGITILKLLTGLPPIGLGRKAFDTDENSFMEMIDPTAGNWPFELAKELLYWSLQCCYHNEKSLELLNDMSTCLEDMLTEIETLQEGKFKVKVRRKKASKDPLKMDDDEMARLVMDDDLTANSSSLSEFGDENLAVRYWESKEVVNPDGDMKLSTQVFFASIDQQSENACSALVAVIAHWFQSNQDSMPTKSQFDSLIQEGSLEWRKLCENQTYRELFPDKHFDLETILLERICPLSIVPHKSFVGFFPIEGMGVSCSFEMDGVISFDYIWDEISLSGSECPHLYIVSWNDHFFVLKVERDAYYIIDTLGENLYRRCDRAYILKFDESTSIRKIQSSGAAEEEVMCMGKESCKEYIKSFLVAAAIWELQAVNKRWGISSVRSPRPLQIEFHYAELLAKDVSANIEIESYTQSKN